jgi:hypothetical protein
MSGRRRSSERFSNSAVCKEHSVPVILLNLHPERIGVIRTWNT